MKQKVRHMLSHGALGFSLRYTYALLLNSVGFMACFHPLSVFSIRIRPKQAVSDCMLIKYTNTPFLKKVSEPLSTVLLYKGSAHVFWCVHVYEIRSLGVLMIAWVERAPSTIVRHTSLHLINEDTTMTPCLLIYAHLARPLIIHQDVPGSKVSVYKALLGQVLHT